MAEAIGGVPAPAMVEWAINEFAVGAQPAAFMYEAGPKMADILYGIGNEQQRHWGTLIVERDWGATMVLTEPDAGSDVGAGRTKAVQRLAVRCVGQECVSTCRFRLSLLH